MERQEGKLTMKDIHIKIPHIHIYTHMYISLFRTLHYTYYKIHIKTKTKKFRTQYTKIVKNSVSDQDVV